MVLNGFTVHTSLEFFNLFSTEYTSSILDKVKDNIIEYEANNSSAFW